MRVLKRDLKHGRIKLRVENPDDLWHLDHIVGRGDMIKAVTMRKVAVKAGGEFRLSEKRPMSLKIQLEKTGFEETSGSLRLAGRIVEGPADTRLSSYHTMQVEPGTVLTVEKGKWEASAMKRIQEAGTREPRILVCVMDREEADIALVRGAGIKNLAHIRCGDPEDREKYHAELLKLLESQQDFSVIVIAGPGFEAGNLLKYVRKKNPALSSKCIHKGASHTGITGINEVMKKSGERILRDTRIGRESRLVEEVLSRIKRDGLVTYGKEEVKKAIEAGAAETLLVSREKIKEFENLMETAEKMKSSVRLITADHSAGEQFLHLGGLAALLRFRTE